MIKITYIAIFCILLALIMASSAQKKQQSCSSCTKYELLDYNPVANLNAVTKENRVRFTVLTDRLIRMEYDLSNKFEDRATLAFVNRNLPVPHYTVDKKDGWLNITTDKLKLMYNS